ncbi:MAG: DUF4878 domain-containing protein [candidate division Zixibacteria bacterium]|nr:DUF4878 domain-containing protein [candidate division Zixibacteria bacterium]
MTKKHIIILLGMCLMALCLGMVSCGGGDSESAESTSSASAGSQKAEAHSKSYPDNPADVFDAFMSEIKAGNISQAFSKYVQNGSALYAEMDANDDAQLREFRQMPGVKHEIISENHSDGDGKCVLEIRFTDSASGKGNITKIALFENNGKWQIGETEF